MKSKKSNRNRAYYRHHRKRVIHRKTAIVKQGFWHVRDSQFGRLSKGKVHCSCSMCSLKTRILGYPKSQQVRVYDVDQQIADARLEYDFN